MSPIVMEKTSVSPSALSALLDAVEITSPATLKSLSAATGLGLSTVARAADLCMRRRILRYGTAADPVSGRACRILLPAEGLLLPVLTLTGGFGSAAVTDMGLTPLCRAVTEFSAATPPEEQARLLAGRCLTLLRGCAGDRQVAAPILVTGEGTEAALFCKAVTDTLGSPPLVLPNLGEATARGLRGLTIPSEADSLLFLSVREGAYATLLLREGDGSWSPSSLGRGLTATLTRALRTCDPSAEGVRRGIAVYLTELCRFLSPRRDPPGGSSRRMPRRGSAGFPAPRRRGDPCHPAAERLDRCRERRGDGGETEAVGGDHGEVKNAKRGYPRGQPLLS